MSNKVANSGSVSNMEIEDPNTTESNGFFGDKSSNKTFLKIAGIIAAVAVLVLVIVLPIYFTVLAPEDPDPPKVPPNERYDCSPDGGGKDDCESRGCIWSPIEDSNAPSCFFYGARSFSTDGETAVTSSEIRSRLKAKTDAPSHFGQQFQALTVRTTYVSKTTLRIKIYPDGDRFEVPLEHPAGVDLPPDALYTVTHVDDEEAFGVRVIRKGNSKTLFDTTVGEMMFADQFLQISTKVASEYIYGFGEHMRETFAHDLNWVTHGMFSRDQGVGTTATIHPKPSVPMALYSTSHLTSSVQGLWFRTGVNLYGVHPYFLCMEGDGNAYGVFFANSNAMDVTLQPTPAITYRTLGGVMDFYLFLGPSPEEVTDQYTALIGRPYFPPFWSLGFQLCRYGYGSLENLKTVVDRNLGKIPYDIQYSDIDYMERQLDFTINPETYDGLGQYVTELKANYSMRYIIILDPAISGNESVGSYPPYENGVRDSVFIKTPQGDIAWGKVWPDYPDVVVDPSQDWDYQTENYRAYTAFPDFYLPKTETWWKDLIVDFHQNGIEFDGLWIDMNEPASFVHGSPTGYPSDSKYDHPPYTPQLASGTIYDKTLCMQSRQHHPTTDGDTDHYNMHSLFGLSQALPTLNACRESTGERCIVISRSTYPGSGKYVGHWLGDNTSKWEFLGASIIGMMEFNLFGIPYIGADICGFFQDATKEMCLRWMQLGAFYPFDRNHNGIGWADQDPGFFGDDFLQASKSVLDTRYKLLPYLYTLFYDAHLTGATVVRPLMNQFPTDTNTYNIGSQFLWGAALLITPVLEESQREVSGYFPSARWYDYYSGTEMATTGMQTLDAPLDTINLHILGGHIIPTQGTGLTTVESRQTPFELIVALDEDAKASGKLFWDDGTSIETVEKMEYTLITFTCESNLLTTSVQHSSEAAGSMTLGSVRVLGISGDVTNVTVDGSKYADFTYFNGELNVTNLNQDMRSRFELRWELGNEWKRIDCMPSMAVEATEGACLSRGCIWNPSPSGFGPSCFYSLVDSTKVPSYSVTTLARAAGDVSYTLKRNEVSQRYGKPVETLKMELQYQTDNRLHFKITDEGSESFEIPEKILNLTSGVTSNETKALYEVNVQTTGTFSITVKRKSTGKILFDTSVGPLVFEEKYLEISTSLPSENVYGLGEHNHRRYRHDLNWKRWAIFTRDVAPVDEWNLYGHQTFYMAIDDTESGSAVGVFLNNANAMDVLLKPEPALTYRIVGGVLDFYIFLGDTQEAVVSQYHSLIGLPRMPPYWALGFQLSRWGYTSLDEIKGISQELIDAEMPYDVQYGDIDYMEDKKSFTYDKVNFNGLPAYSDELHDKGMRFVVILDPGIKIEEGYKAYDDGMRDDIFIKNPEGTSPVLTEVWPGDTYHPDFTHPNASMWWFDQCDEFYHDQSVHFDGLWIDMNEPSNFQPDNPDKLAAMNCSDEYNRLPYMPNILWHGVGLHDKTICMENQQYLGLHFDYHSLYGHTMSMATYEALERLQPDLRNFVITRSTYAGTGKYAQHWLGDNQSQWRQMPWPIPALFEFNLFGFPFSGADLCGFYFNTTAEMCQRWMEVGAFYPFSRNHNAAGMIHQHPTAFGDDVTASSKKALEIRYSILPYIYTRFHHISHHGGTLVRALVHEFPSDKNTWDADRQFLLGSGFLVTPVMEEGARRVTGYFPKGARWYDFHTNKELTERGKFVSLDAPLDHINLHVRGGTIIPMQKPGVTTTVSRKNPMWLLVPLDDDQSASGMVYWDDGEASDIAQKRIVVSFSCKPGSLSFQIVHSPTGFDVSDLHYEKITVLGLAAEEIACVSVDEEEGSGCQHADFTYVDHTLVITGVTLLLDELHEIQWS